MAESKSSSQKAARAGRVAGGLVKIAAGLASQNYVQAIVGAIEVIPWKKIFIIVGVLLLLVLLPIIIIVCLPQLLINWAASSFTDLITRSSHGTAMTSYYYEVVERQEDGVEPDINFLICVDAVRTNQQVEMLTPVDVELSILSSFTKDPVTGDIYNRTQEEIMTLYGFTDEQKNWTRLMYNTITGQTVAPDGEFVDADRLDSYDGVSLDGITYYNQLDERWANIKYGLTDTIGVAGCGPTALAIAVSTLTGIATDPVDVSEWSYANGYVCEGSGSYISLIPAAAEHYGLTVEKLGRSSAEELKTHLQAGKLIIAIMGAGHFTSTGHFIVLRGLTDDGKVLVADPVSYNRSTKAWDISIILNEVKNAGSGGPFWALSL